MPALASRIVLALALVAGASGCKKKVTQEQCNQLVDHFAELVVKERFPDAGPDAIKAEQARERQEAAHDNEFKNCASEVQIAEFECAMKAEASAALIKCLE